MQPPLEAAKASNAVAGQLELARLVDLAAERLKLTIDYDAAAIKGTVTLRSEGGLSDIEIWELTNRVLAARGFTTVRQSGTANGYSIVRLQDAAAAAPFTRGRAEAEPGVPQDPQPVAGFQTLAIRAKHRTARDLADQLGRVLGKGPGAGGAGGAGGITTIGDPEGGAGTGSGGGLLIISDLSTRVEQAQRIIELLDTPGARTVMEEVPLRNLAAAPLITLLNQVVAKKDAVAGGGGGGSAGGGASSGSTGGDRLPGEVLALPDGNAVLLIAPQGRLAEWKELIAAVDRREQVQTLTYTPRHFSAKDVAKLVEDTVRVRAAGAGSGSSPGSDERLRVVIDELTGSLVITATPTQHEAVQSLVDRLDRSPAGTRRPVRTYTIKNRSVTEVVEVLERLLRAGALEATADEGSGSSGSSGSSLPPSAAGAAGTSFPMPPPPVTSGAGNAVAGASARSDPGNSSAYSPNSASGRDPRRSSPSPTSVAAASSEPPVTFTTDKGTNTLITAGEPRILDQIEKLLVTLDVRQPQVMLDVLMVTLTDGQTLDLGVELEKLDVNGDVFTRLSSLFGLGTRTNNGDRDGPANASGFTGVVLNPGDFSIVLRALETLNQGRSLSMPQLLVGNNEQATLDSVVQQPFASVNASNTVSTTSFGGTQDAGTVVTVQPQIAEGDHLVLQYSVSLSSFLGAASSPTLPPARQQNRVQSIATIPDGSTVIVGGIEVNTDGQSTSQIPVLGNIPIIGEAFKSRSKNNSRSRFFVFIRANILRNQNFEDLKYLSERQVEQAGVDDGWPQVRPAVIR